MYVKTDFLWVSPKYVKQYIGLYNEYSEKLVNELKNINIPDVEPFTGSMQECLDNFIGKIELMCEGTGFNYREPLSLICKAYDDIDEGFRAYKFSCRDGFFKRQNTISNLFFGQIKNEELNLSFYIDVDAEINADQIFCYISLFINRFKEFRIQTELMRAEKLIPVVEYLVKKDYGDLKEQLENLKMEELTSNQVIKMNESALEIFIRGLCKKYELQYSIKKDNRGQIVLIRLSGRRCLWFRIKPEKFAEQKDEIENCLKQALDFVQTKKITAAIKFYDSAELWKN